MRIPTASGILKKTKTILFKKILTVLGFKCSALFKVFILFQLKCYFYFSVNEKYFKTFSFSFL